MIIHSLFHDYYDVVAKSMGFDPGIRWFRDKLVIGEERKSYRFGDRSDYIMLWFCRKMYRIVEMTSPHDYTDKHYFYNITEIDDYVEANTKKREREFWYGTRKRNPIGRLWGPMWCGNRGNHRKFFEPTSYPGAETEMAKLAAEHRSPIVTYRSSTGQYTVNDQLSEYDLVRVIPPYTAYQEITMYLGGLAMPEKTIPHISDKDMVEIKGFDPVYSFRKDKKQRG